MKPEGRTALIPWRMMVDVCHENADVCGCVGAFVLFCFVLYLISRHEFPSSHPDHFAMNGNLP